MIDLGIASAMEPNPFIYLLEQGFSGSAVTRMEGRVVAIRAASRADGPIPVRTGEAGINDQFLQPLPVDPMIAAGRSVVSLALRKVKHTIKIR